MKKFKNFLKRNIKKFDLIVAIFAIIGYMGVIARKAMAKSDKKLTITLNTFKKLKYLPVRDHYYEPLTFEAIGGKYRERVASLLFNSQKDFNFLNVIARPSEFLADYNRGQIYATGFKFGNKSFESGDAEILYYVVRHFKPKIIIEVGAGQSSLIIHAAMKLNSAEGYIGRHTIIEPFENAWLEKLGATVIRERVELVEFSEFMQLDAGDILFIDSSHVVRSQNDCVFEYTELLPSLRQGVVVHIHDIFTPFDYPDEWINKDFRIWTEQYIVEVLLSDTSKWEILAPLNWLSQNHEEFKRYCPFYTKERSPGSLWIRRR